MGDKGEREVGTRDSECEGNWKAPFPSKYIGVMLLNCNPLAVKYLELVIETDFGLRKRFCAVFLGSFVARRWGVPRMFRSEKPYSDNSGQLRSAFASDPGISASHFDIVDGERFR